MNLAEETRCGYVISADMKKLWKCQMDLLLEFTRVCKKKHLTFFACGGTLLGAVRHKGFIPWDDDIDVGMLRKDYDQLLKVPSSEFKEGYFLQNTYTDNIVRAHSQLRKEGTTCVIKEDFGKKYNRGVFLDIFVFDNLPDDDELLHFSKSLKRKFTKISPPSKKLASKRSPFLIFGYNFVAYPFLYLLYIISLAVRGGRKHAFASFEKYASQYDDKKCLTIGNITFECRLEKVIRFDRTCFSSFAPMKFEDVSILVPAGYDQLLRKQYGDYNKYVIGKSSHGELYFDTDKSYKELPKTRGNFLKLFK